MKFTTPRGTKDILPDQIAYWNHVEKVSRDIFRVFGYREIRTPIFEETALFVRSLGNTSDIVQKQMLNVAMDKEKGYCLRPEATAAIVRAYLEHNLDKQDDLVKLFYIGPMFRGERPQKGRLRQFHHIGVEAIGLTLPQIDAEVINLATRILEALRITGYKLKINSLGCSRDRQNFSKTLKEALKNKTRELCKDCQERLNRNVLRVLDCKQEACKATVNNLKLEGEYLCLDCRDYFQQVQHNLAILKVPFEVNFTLVRGLDYYTHTVFEISHPDLGSQDALGAGGRYDNLVKELGGSEKGATGFAFGFERILLVMKEGKVEEPPEVFFISLGSQAQERSYQLINDVRQQGVACETAHSPASLKSQMRQANDNKARFVLITGDDEIKKGEVTLKDMASGEQESVKNADLLKVLKEKLRR